MATSPQRRTDELRERHRRIRRGGLAGSVLLHLLLALLLRGDVRPLSPYSAAGPRAGDDRAAPAGGGMQAVRLRALSPPEERRVPRPPEPIPTPDVTVEPEDLPEPELPPIDFANVAVVPGAIGAGDAPEVGTGLDGGEGKGDGGTEAEGRFRVVPPTPRGLILPPSDRPDEVRGKEVEVWVFVAVDGRVVPDSTRVIPSSGDSGFDRRLKEQAAQWVFDPARKQGRVVAEWFRYVISL
ncbi:MAG TPA: hypothetical protein VF212_16255 [Longimicrobiales bacterium]